MLVIVCVAAYESSRRSNARCISVVSDPVVEETSTASTRKSVRKSVAGSRAICCCERIDDRVRDVRLWCESDTGDGLLLLCRKRGARAELLVKRFVSAKVCFTRRLD